MLRVRHLVVPGLALASAMLFLAAPAGAARPSTVPHITYPYIIGETFTGDSCPSTTWCTAIGTNRYKKLVLNASVSEILQSGTWTAMSPPAPKTNNILVYTNGESCATSSACVWVGKHYNPGKPPAQIAEWWNGTVWKIVSASGPTGSTASRLIDVSCPAASFCMAVGDAKIGSHAQATVYTWVNHTAWKQISVPAPAGARSATLDGVSCAAATDCMAVGDYVNASGTTLPYAVGWHTGTWQPPSSMPGVGGLSNDQLKGVSCPSATECLAVGIAGTTVQHAFAEELATGSWSVVLTGPAATGLYGASCPTTSMCAVGGFSGGAPLVESWNGSSFSDLGVTRTGSPTPNDVIMHVSCPTTTKCEAVGTRYNNLGMDFKTLGEGWNGSSWTVQTTLNL